MYALAKRITSLILLLMLVISSAVPVWAKQESRFVEESIAWLDGEEVHAQILLDKEYDSVEMWFVQGEKTEKIDYTDEDQISVRIDGVSLAQSGLIQLKGYQSKRLVRSALFRIGYKNEEDSKNHNPTEKLDLHKEKWNKRIDPEAQTIALELLNEGTVETHLSLEKQAKSYYKRYFGEIDPEKINNKEDVKEKTIAKGANASFELEPNDTIAKADWSFIGKDAYGRIIRSGDIDYWKVKAPNNGTLKIWLGEMPNGQNYDLTVYDAEGIELGRSENSGGTDELVEGIGVEKNIWYYILVKARGDDFDKKNYYRLKSDYLPEQSEVNPDENEPNNNKQEATRLEPGRVLEANLHTPGDVDYYQIDVNLASTIEVSLKDIPTGMDLDIYLLNNDQKQLARSENAQNKDEQLVFNGDPGTYYIKVAASRNSVITSNQYKLSAEVHTVPVILIPGLGGSRLSVSENGQVSEAWFDAIGKKEDFMMPVHRRVLTLQPRTPGSEKVVPREPGITIFPEEGDDGFRAIEYLSYSMFAQDISEQYHSMVEHLRSIGYEKNKTLFAFPYDWRMSNTDNAVFLKKKIDEALMTSKAKQVQLVVHSMGGLLARETLLESPSYQTKTKRLIYMGTPFLGSPRAYQAIRFGYNFGIPIVNPETIRQIAQFAPAVYETLPSREYMKKQSYLTLVENTKPKKISYDQFLSDPRFKLEYQPLVKLSERQHAKWDKKTIQIPQYVIVGDGKSTLSNFEYHAALNHRFPVYDEKGGDGTVPLVSADFNSKEIKRKYYISEQHSSLMTNPYVIQQVAHLLLGIEKEQPGLRTTPQKTKLNYYTIYNEDGSLPDVSLLHEGKRYDLTKTEHDNVKDNLKNFKVEYFGNIIVVHMLNDQEPVKFKNNNKMKDEQLSGSKIIIKQYSSSFKGSNKERKYSIDEDNNLVRLK